MFEITSEIFSIFILVLGISYFTQSQLWLKLAKTFIHKHYQILPFALLTLLIGLTIVATHNRWELSWNILITLLGWIIVIKSSIFLIFPRIAIQFALNFKQSLSLIIRMSGLIMVILGAILFYKNILS